MSIPTPSTGGPKPKAAPKFVATYSGHEGFDINKIGAACDAVMNAGDRLTLNIIPAPTKNGYRMCAIVELQYGDKVKMRLRKAEFEDDTSDERLATPFTLSQEFAQGNNAFAANYEDRLFEAAIKKMGNKISIKAIEEKVAAAA